ncbi:MAG: sodium:proton antiporter [Desulfurococcaceae archaeon]|jgi:multicomponent Na+:H+ antiporter subunit C
MTLDFINTYLMLILLSSLLVNVVLTIYGIFFKPHYTKKVIALTILSDTLNTFTVYIGYRRWVNELNPRPPILTVPPTTESIIEFAERAVDPLPQALVLTAVVIGLAVTLFLVFLGYILYAHYKTLDMREIRKLKG